MRLRLQFQRRGTLYGVLYSVIWIIILRASIHLACEFYAFGSPSRLPLPTRSVLQTLSFPFSESLLVLLVMTCFIVKSCRHPEQAPLGSRYMITLSILSI